MKNNEIIAEFMGDLKLTKVKDDKIIPYIPDYCIWETIIPVVGKCKDTHYKVANGPQLYRKIELALLTLNLQKVIRACLDYINAYNNQLCNTTKRP